MTAAALPTQIQPHTHHRTAGIDEHVGPAEIRLPRLILPEQIVGHHGWPFSFPVPPKNSAGRRNYHTYLGLLSEQCDVGLRLFLVLFLATGWVAA
jgi:hypothetical protein